MSQEAAVGSQLCAAALTPKEKLFFTNELAGRQQRDKQQLTGRICWVCDDASCVPSVSACWGRNHYSP